jgi:hypothetical protein
MMFHAKTLQTYFNADGNPGSLQKGIERICRYAEDAVADGFEVLILSDRALDSDTRRSLHYWPYLQYTITLLKKACVVP